MQQGSFKEKSILKDGCSYNHNETVEITITNNKEIDHGECRKLRDLFKVIEAGGLTDCL